MKILVTNLRVLLNSCMESKAMHKKHLGSVGEVKVALELMKLGYPVFSELGDLSKTDLITLVNGKPIKIQVKCYHSKDGIVEFSTRKSGPNYQYTYEPQDVDIFAVYVPDREQILYFGWDKLEGKVSMSFRFDKAGRGQRKRINLYEDFIDFEKAIAP